jgi:hypothetical protein
MDGARDGACASGMDSVIGMDVFLSPAAAVEAATLATDMRE